MARTISDDLKKRIPKIDELNRISRKSLGRLIGSCETPGKMNNPTPHPDSKIIAEINLDSRADLTVESYLLKLDCWWIYDI